MCLKKYKVHGTSIDTHENEQQQMKIDSDKSPEWHIESFKNMYLITLRYISSIMKVVKLNHNIHKK